MLYAPEVVALLAQEVTLRASTQSIPFIVGVYGPQGSGKTTISHQLSDALHAKGFSVQTVSLDDFYLSQKDRQQLADSISPLLKTRGVPGTHDYRYGICLFEKIKSRRSSSELLALKLPKFDKASDNPVPEAEWPPIHPDLDILIFEGWCVGVPDMLHDELTENPQPLNRLESEYDPDGNWREYVAFKNFEYQQWYNLIDFMIGIEIPSFKAVLAWRWQQEQHLFEITGTRLFQSEQEVAFFVAHFERITRVAQAHLSEFCDLIIKIDEQHQVQQIKNLTAGASVEITSAQKAHFARGECLVFTDLDGTLLGHDDYDIGPALALIQQIYQQGWQCVFNTSKTWAEVAVLQERFGCFGPSIIENGAAVHLGSSAWQPSLLKGKDRWVSPHGMAREQINDILDEFTLLHPGVLFERMRDWSDETVSKHTGLSVRDAKLSNSRLYSEPLLWQSHADGLNVLSSFLVDRGLNLVKGGRFWHVMGPHDKSGAMAWVIQAYQQDFKLKPVTIALGDNHNDVSMLEAADIACVIRLPGKPWLSIRHPQMLKAEQVAPRGWVEVMQKILSSAQSL